MADVLYTVPVYTYSGLYVQVPLYVHHGVLLLAFHLDRTSKYRSQIHISPSPSQCYPYHLRHAKIYSSCTFFGFCPFYIFPFIFCLSSFFFTFSSFFSSSCYLFTQMTSAAVSFIPVGGYFLLYRYTPDAYILWSWLYFILPTYLYCMSANTWCLLFHKFLATIYSGIDVNFN